LAHTPGQLIRVLFQPTLRISDADETEQLFHALVGGGLGGAAMLL
jgi:hypothetical protein